MCVWTRVWNGEPVLSLCVCLHLVTMSMLISGANNAFFHSDVTPRYHLAQSWLLPSSRNALLLCLDIIISNFPSISGGSFSVSISSSFSTYPVNLGASVLSSLLTLHPYVSRQYHLLPWLPSSFMHSTSIYWDLHWCQAFCWVLEMQACLIYLPTFEEADKKTDSFTWVCMWYMQSVLWEHKEDAHLWGSLAGPSGGNV